MNRWAQLRAWIARLDPLLVDSAVAIAAVGLSLAEMQGYADTRDRSMTNAAFVLLQTGPLAIRRRLPFTVFAVGAMSLAVQGRLDFHSPTFAFLGVNLALYSLAAYGDRRLAATGASVWACLLTLRLAQLVVTTWPQVAISELYDVFDDYVLLGAVWILGHGIRQRRIHAAELEDRRFAWSETGRRRRGRRWSRNGFT